jgi:repressor LexA
MVHATPNRIRELRESAGVSQDELAARIGGDVRGATVSRLENGRMVLTLDWMLKIAKGLQVPVTDLIAESASPVRMVPVIGQISAGAWQEAVAEPNGWVPIPPGAAGPKAFALKPLGDSMNLVVIEEGYAVIDPDQRELVPGKVYAFRNEHGETTFKRYIDSPPRLEPCSTNPEHKPFLLGSEPLVVIGRVVFAVQPVE